MLYRVTLHLPFFLLESDITAEEMLCLCGTKRNPSAHSLVLVIGAVGGVEGTRVTKISGKSCEARYLLKYL